MLAVVGGGVWESAGSTARFVSLHAVPSGRRLARWEKLAPVKAVAFSPDGFTLAVATAGVVELREVATGGVREVFAPAQAPLAFAPDGTLLAAVGMNQHVYLWDVRSGVPAADLAAAWEALAGADAVAAFRAQKALAADPARAVPFLGSQPAEELSPTAGAIAKLVESLDAPAFADRAAAEKELRRVGPPAEPALRKALAETTSPEVRQRAGAVLAAPPRPPTPAELRAGRAAEALGWIGTNEAAAVLRAWAGGDGRLRRTAAARAALANR